MSENKISDPPAAGATVTGLLVGDGVGVFVGDFVGDDVGELVGELVGAVGDEVGEFVGELVGENVNAPGNHKQTNLLVNEHDVVKNSLSQLVLTVLVEPVLVLPEVLLQSVHEPVGDNVPVVVHPVQMLLLTTPADDKLLLRAGFDPPIIVSHVPTRVPDTDLTVDDTENPNVGAIVASVLTPSHLTMYPAPELNP